MLGMDMMLKAIGLTPEIIQEKMGEAQALLQACAKSLAEIERQSKRTEAKIDLLLAKEGISYDGSDSDRAALPAPGGDGGASGVVGDGSGNG